MERLNYRRSLQVCFAPLLRPTATMIDRRAFLVTGGAIAATAASSSAEPTPVAQPTPDAPSITFCLNMSTLRGQQLTLPEQVRVAAEAGYDSIEPWMGDLQKFVESGGRLADLHQQIQDAGMTVASAIGFAEWIVDDVARRAAGLAQARRDMEMVAAIGGQRIAAPPVGAQRTVGPPLPIIAERYRVLLELGRETGVRPQLELWGFSTTLSRLGELAYVATESRHEDACVLPDFYHIYKGGNDFASLGMIEASRMHVFHINDYPAEPSLTDIEDKHRVFPGDGVCPLPQVIASLIRHGFAGAFSLELFNPEYWKRDALEVAREGLEKSRAVVASAMELV